MYQITIIISSYVLVIAYGAFILSLNIADKLIGADPKGHGGGQAAVKSQYLQTDRHTFV